MKNTCILPVSCSVYGKTGRETENDLKMWLAKTNTLRSYGRQCKIQTMKISFTTDSSEQTERFGEALSKYWEAGTVIALDGDLGAGKTCLTRGIARGMGSEDPVASPTFTIVNEYSGGRLMLFHFDTYRLSGEDDFYASGLDEYFLREGVCVIEWGGVIEGALPGNTVKMKISGNGDERRFDVTETGSLGAENLIRAAAEAGCEVL